MVNLFGISNCDTVRKARNWLKQNNIEHRFHDFRKEGLETEQIQVWVKNLGWEKLLNKRGTTWRQLPDTDKENLDQESAIKLMARHPTLIKRPVLEYDKKIDVGFSQQQFQQIFQSDVTMQINNADKQRR